MKGNGIIMIQFWASSVLVMISDEDIDLVGKYGWFCNSGYAVAWIPKSEPRKLIYLHKIIGERIGLFGEIDHKNRIRSDSQRTNLRECTRAQNVMNGKTRNDNQVGHKGIDRKGDKYRVQISINGKKKHLCYVRRSYTKI